MLTIKEQNKICRKCENSKSENNKMSHQLGYKCKVGANIRKTGYCKSYKKSEEPCKYCSKPFHNKALLHGKEDHVEISSNLFGWMLEGKVKMMKIHYCPICGKELD